MFLPIHDENPTIRWPFVTVAIVVLNCVLLFYMESQPAERQIALSVHHGFVPARMEQLLGDPKPVEVELPVGVEAPPQPGQAAPEQEMETFRLPADRGAVALSLLSSMFLHGGWLHLLGNMWFLWVFGNNIEDRLGHVLFLLFYLVGGVVAALCHWAMTATPLIPVVGASGAVAAMLGAYLVTYPTARVKVLAVLIVIFTIIEVPAWLVLAFWMGAQCLSALVELKVQIHGGVAWWAHIGGFLFGMLLMPLLAAGTPEPGKSWDEEARRQFDLG